MNPGTGQLTFGQKHPKGTKKNQVGFEETPNHNQAKHEEAQPASELEPLARKTSEDDLTLDPKSSQKEGS